LTQALRAPHVVDFSYRRSTGGAVGLFLAGLAKGEVWASRSPGGRVEVPPVDWDPETGAAVEDFVRLADEGTVRSWTWVSRPQADQPLDRPFALALIQIDGADTSLLHVVDAGDEAQMATGMKVRADWRKERAGSILDIRAFVPDPGHRGGPPQPPPAAAPDRDPRPEVISNARISYSYEPGLTLSRFLRALAEHRIEGGRCPSCSAVYVPPHPRCPECRVGPLEAVEVADRGSVVSYTVVHLPFPGITLDLPFVSAWIRLDGADVPFAHLLGEIGPGDVVVGQRVEAVWVADEDLAPTWESIRYFRPAAVGGPGWGAERT
jgi:uncharacterized OB-fold protein